MDFLAHNIHNVLDKSLQGLTEQQLIIQQNLSNIDTPGYKRKKFDYDKYMEIDKKVKKVYTLKTTNPKHISSNYIMNDSKPLKIVRYDEDHTLWTDNTGNNVSLDKENVAMSKNNIHSTAIINMYQKYSTMYKDTINTLAK